MKKIILFLYLLSLHGIAQDIDLIWSEKIPTKSKTDISILGSNGGQFYTTYVDREDQLVGRIYDNNMSLIKEKNIDFDLQEDTKYTYKGAYFLKNSILHFVYQNNKKQKQTFLYGAFSDFQLNSVGKISVLNEVEDDKVVNFGLRSISPDSTKILTYHEIKNKKKEPNVLVYRVYDSSLKSVINEGAASLPIKSRNYSTEEIRVDNLGNVFIMAEIIKEKREKVKGYANNFYKLIVFTKDKKVKEFDFDFPNNIIDYIDIIPGENNTFFCTGFLKGLKEKKRTALVTDEMFFTTIDCETMKTSEMKIMKVPGLYPDKIKKAKDRIPYKIREIYKKSNGGYSIIAEQYKLVVSYNAKTGQTYYYYYYCDIAVIQTTSKNEVTSVTRMPKYQLNAENPSLISTFKNDKTYIIFEDITSNLNAGGKNKTKRSTASLFSSGGKNSLFLLEVSEDGKMDKNIIYEYKESKIKPNVQGSREVKPGQILLNARDQIGLFTIRS